MVLRIEALERRHKPLLSKFENQHPSLTEYVRDTHCDTKRRISARLAVDQRVQGQGVGRYLLREALGLTLDLIGLDAVSFRLLVTDALDEAAACFYEHHGFARLATEAPCRLVLDLGPLTSR